MPGPPAVVERRRASQGKQPGERSAGSRHRDGSRDAPNPERAALETQPAGPRPESRCQARTEEGFAPAAESRETENQKSSEQEFSCEAQPPGGKNPQHAHEQDREERRYG